VFGIRSEDDWIELYQKKGALWLHDNNPKRPHALLTSGKHSNGFFNSELVMEDPVLLDEACTDLMDILFTGYFNFGLPQRVVGPAMGAITLAHDLARKIGHRRSWPCLRAYVEKEGEGESARMIFKRTNICAGERVLLVEDVLTTGGSVDMATKAIEDVGGVVLPFVVVLVNRSGLKEVNGKRIVALIDRPMPMWNPDECPLCQQGSEAIRPKTPIENWARLNTTY
jgi:orotate phosphoribosyltransferase